MNDLMNAKVDAIADRICVSQCGVPFRDALGIALERTSAPSSPNALAAVCLAVLVLEACNVRSEEVYARHGFGRSSSCTHFSLGLVQYRHRAGARELFQTQYDMAAGELGITKDTATDGEGKTPGDVRGEADGGTRPAGRAAGRGRSLAISERARPWMDSTSQGNEQPRSGAAHDTDTPAERARRRA